MYVGFIGFIYRVYRVYRLRVLVLSAALVVLALDFSTSHDVREQVT